MSDTSLTIRVSKSTRETPRDLDSKSNSTITAIVDKAVEELRRKKFWADFQTACEAARADLRDGDVAWEDTLADGLEQELTLDERKKPRRGKSGAKWSLGSQPQPKGRARANGCSPRLDHFPRLRQSKPKRSRDRRAVHWQDSWVSKPCGGQPARGGLPKPSVVMTENVRSISKSGLIRRLGVASPGTMKQLKQILRIVLDF